MKIAERKVFAIGLGTANMGDKVDKLKQGLEAIRAGLDNDIQVIDPAESYGNGNSERLVAQAIKPY